MYSAITLLVYTSSPPYAGVEVSLVVFGSDSPTPVVWSDGDQSRKAEKTVRKYLYLPSNRQAPINEKSSMASRRRVWEILVRVWLGRLRWWSGRWINGRQRNRPWKRSRLGFWVFRRWRKRPEATSVAGTGDMDNSCPSTAMLCSGELSTEQPNRSFMEMVTCDNHTAMQNESHGSYIIVVGMYLVLELAWGKHALVIVSTTKFIIRSLYISYVVAKIAEPTSCYSLISLIYWSVWINLYLIVVIN